ncbi:hypothetical protein [Litorivivens sp.]|uniref:hypothetical protein n=1 Tax=Litorivivens sp. TaxID=2020868 RepID=UPI00356222E6
MKSAANKESTSQSIPQATTDRHHFAMPDAYQSGDRKMLRAFFSGDWWLNVDYVEHESQIRHNAMAA